MSGYTTLGLATPGATTLKVLVADGVTDRANSFHIRGNNYRLRHVPTLPDLMQALTEDSWDLVFLSTYLGSWDNCLQAIPLVINAYRGKRLRGVVLMSPVTDDALKQLKLLKEGKVPVTYYPYKYDAPSVHKVFPPPDGPD